MKSRTVHCEHSQQEVRLPGDGVQLDDFREPADGGDRVLPPVLVQDDGEVDTSCDAARHLRRTREQLDSLAAVPGTGVLRRHGHFLERHAGVDRSWVTAVDDVQPLPQSALPPGATAGFAATLPLCDTPRYLPWLQAETLRRGVRIRAERVQRMEELAGRYDLVVIAAGLRSPDLLGDDDTMTAVRGQVVRLRNNGLTDWLIDHDHPDGLLYIFPRSGDIVIGGTADVDGPEDYDLATEQLMLHRAVVAMPALAGRAVLSRAVGHRPVRPRLRIETLYDHPMPVVTCYGHGGAGCTISWGTAEDVRHLVVTALGLDDPDRMEQTDVP